ncbi:MAG: ADP-ribosyltransferase [Acidimicrobiales bacterium]
MEVREAVVEAAHPHEVTEPTVELAARLTKSTRAVAASATGGELDAVRRYQALDRTYEMVNRLLRDEPGADELSDAELAEVRDIVRGLSRLVERWRTPEPLRVYRGLRSRAGLTDVGMITRSFLATTIVRDVAIEEFTVPPAPSGPALLEIDVPAGVPAVWVPPLGDPSLAYQGELLLPRRQPLLVRSSSEEAGILVMDREVEL